MTSSVHIDNKGRDTVILGEGPTQEIDETTLTAEAKYAINFTQLQKRFYAIMEVTVSYLLIIQKYISQSKRL